MIFSVVCLSLAVDYKYVGSKSSDKYHFPDCKWAKKISPKNLVTFKTAQEAEKAGYVPCKVCKPPTKD
jgi:micrococcal nuclease